MTDSLDNSPSINGHTVSRLLVNVPNKGPWYAECDVPVEAKLAGRVTIKLGNLELIGTVVTEQSGTFGQTNCLRVVAGGAGWGRELAARAYHNDAGVKAAAVAADAARECGETLGDFIPASERLGPDYVRNTGHAARTLEAAAGAGVVWWVDYAGVTHAGPRAPLGVPSSAYHVIAYNPRERTVLLGVKDPAAVPMGSIISEHLDEPGTVRDLQLWADKDELRMLAWLGGGDASSGRLTGLVRDIVERATDGRLYGCYRYRLVSMAAGGRFELQAVRRSTGLPDLSPVSAWPGIPGAYPNLTPGAEVLVQFIDGDRAFPVVTHFAGKDEAGFVPVSLVLGGSEGAPAARQGDTVDVLLMPSPVTGNFTGLIGDVPATGVVMGVVTFPSNKTLGIITAGSSKVKVAT